MYEVPRSRLVAEQACTEHLRDESPEVEASKRRTFNTKRIPRKVEALSNSSFIIPNYQLIKAFAFQFF